MRRAIIMGAAGRDFHNFNVFFRKNKEYLVVAFTAAQIPGIAHRRYPALLAGRRYPKGIPIHDESELAKFIRTHHVDDVFFSYSDVSYEYVMHHASIAMAAGANFSLLGHRQTQLSSKAKVISVCAGRTGSGKSQTAQKTAELFKKAGKRVVVVRHPMPYGNLAKQVVQRFSSFEDLERHKCTIEEMEEYERYVSRGITVFAGVDYGAILHQAEREADVIIWDGGNNDVPFYKPDVHIVVVDPHRVGDELRYYPGEENVRLADIIIINKENTASKENVEKMVRSVSSVNRDALVIHADSTIILDASPAIRGKRVLVIEDGPTLTHGGMHYGAGVIAAQKAGATLIDPRPYAVGSIKRVLQDYPSLMNLVPAMGYSKTQMHELEKTIENSRCDAVVVGTPIDLARHITIKKPVVRVHYTLREKNVTLEHIFKMRKLL